jgi:aminoglycoside 2'-N-acetyltransferase I
MPITSGSSSSLALTLARAEALSPAQRAEIIALCARAFDEPFDVWFDVLPGSTHVLGWVDGVLVSHAAWVTRWLQPEGLPLLRTAYVEAVATAPEHQGKGHATAVLRDLAARLGGYDLGGLSPSDAKFYARLGWESWCGPTAIRLPEGGLLDTPGEDVMILRLPGSPALDLDARLTAEWRRGELW